MQEKMLAQFLKEFRERKDWTQTDVAKKARVSLRTIQSIEWEERVGYKTAKKVVEALGYKLIVNYSFEKVKNVEK